MEVNHMQEEKLQGGPSNLLERLIFILLGPSIPSAPSFYTLSAAAVGESIRRSRR
jgi:hypothetical protein